MKKLANYTVEELEDLLNEGDLTVEEMYNDYMDATGESDLIRIELNVGRDLNVDAFDYSECKSLVELEEFLLSEDTSFQEEMDDILMDLTLNVVEAFTIEGMAFYEDEAFSIVEDVRMSLDGHVNFEIDFTNPTPEFANHFAEEMVREDGELEVWLTMSTDHKVGVHSVKLSVINSARNRFVADFDTIADALAYANAKGIEVKIIKNR